MTTTMLVFVTAAVSGAIFFLAGWYLGRRSQQPGLVELMQDMRRVVNIEETEHSARLRKAEMVAARRRSVPRPGTGSARIGKVRFRRP